MMLLSWLQCEASASIRGFFDLITDESAPKIMLIGSDCSVSSEPIAEISHHWNLVQVCFIYANVLNCSKLEIIL